MPIEHETLLGRLNRADWIRKRGLRPCALTRTRKSIRLGGPTGRFWGTEGRPFQRSTSFMLIRQCDPPAACERACWLRVRTLRCTRA
jgi:hypothetical protein